MKSSMNSSKVKQRAVSRIYLGCLAMLLSLAFISSCRYSEFEEVEVDGLAPVYIEYSELKVKSESPREFGELGKIVVIDTILLINELYKGIHVVNNADAGNPVGLVFWNITGNIDFTVAGDLLYADNSLDLYTIDISDIYNIQLLNTTENIYQTPQSEQFYPVGYDGYFECVNPERGIVIDWEEKFLIDPKCRTTP